MNKLVSIITPCYKGEKEIYRLLNSVLCQTYPNIEMFVIDDGSTDNSAEIIKSYIPRFNLRGYDLTYIYQENSGQSVAINQGLKLYTGDFLVWPDSDDFYATNDAIEQMVNILDKSDDSVSMIRCLSYFVNEQTLKRIGKIQVNKNAKNKVDLFEDCLFELNGYWYIPGNYMAKSEKIDEYIPDKEIYVEKDAGQNWQLMLPLLYNNKCLTINKFLYNILARKKSHSRGKYSTFEQLLIKYSAHENTLIHTINKIVDMPALKKEKYKQKIVIKYKQKRFYIFLDYRKFKEARAILMELGNPKKMLFEYYYFHIPFAGLFYKIIMRLQRIARTYIR